MGAGMRPWVEVGAFVRLHPILDQADGHVVHVYAVRPPLVLIGEGRGKTGTAWVDETLIDVPAKPPKGRKR